MQPSRLTVGATCFVLVALFGLCISEASCSGKEGTCNAANCGAVETVDLGFTCEEYGVPPYATIVQTTVAGACKVSCLSPTPTGECWLEELDPTGSGGCDVQVTSSTGAVFPVTYTWVSRQIAIGSNLCPGCFTLDLADGGRGFNPFARNCDGGVVVEGGNDGGADGG